MQHHRFPKGATLSHHNILNNAYFALCTRGYSVMLGYWNNAEATRQAIDSARWTHTGDLAVMDAEGYVNIIVRIKEGKRIEN